MTPLNLTCEDLQRKELELSKLPITNTAAPCTVLFVRTVIAELLERRAKDNGQR